MAGITQTQKAQGATEYLVLLSVVLMIVLVCIALLVWPTGTTKDVKQSQSDIKCGIAKNAVPDIMQGMVAYYKFDEGSGTLTYDRKTGTSGTLTNGPTWTIGKSGNALDFNGVDNYVNTSSSWNTLLNGGTSDFTLSFWFKSTSAVVAKMMVGSYVDAGGTGLSAWLSNGAAWFRIKATGTPLGFAQATLSGTYNDGAWHHLLCTGNRATLAYCYVDGTLKGSADISNHSAALSTTKLSIGGDGSSGVVFTGTIDEVLIYNRALSADEIKYLHEYPGCP